MAVTHISQQRGRGYSAEAPWLCRLKLVSLYRTWNQVVSHRTNTTDIPLSNLRHTKRFKIMAAHTTHFCSRMPLSLVFVVRFGKYRLTHPDFDCVYQTCLATRWLGAVQEAQETAFVSSSHNQIICAGRHVLNGRCMSLSNTKTCRKVLGRLQAEKPPGRNAINPFFKGKSEPSHRDSTFQGRRRLCVRAAG